MTSSKFEWWHRKVQPFHLGLMLAMFVVAIEYNIFQSGPGHVISDWFSGGFAMTAGLLLGLGWITKNDAMARWGLVLAAAVMAARAFMGFADEDFGFGSATTWLSLCWFIAAVGTWALESYDYHDANTERQRDT
jgi:hypothetical protein